MFKVLRMISLKGASHKMCKAENFKKSLNHQNSFVLLSFSEQNVFVIIQLTVYFQASLTKLSSSFMLKFISAFKALNTFKMVSIVALFALFSSLEIWAF